MQIKKYLGNKNISISDLPTPESIRISKYKHEQFNTAEVIFLTSSEETFRMFDRIKLETSTFDWYIISSVPKLISYYKLDGVSYKRYRHTMILTELTEKLKRFPLSNLAFNNFLSGDKLFENLFDIVERVRIVTPFELTKDINNTRIWKGTNNTNDTVWKQKGYTEALYDLLISQTDITEDNNTYRNVYELLLTKFNKIGGVPKLIVTDWSESVLDIELFDEEKPSININNYIDYEAIKNFNNYANTAEITTNNIINENSPYISGLTTGKVLQSEEVLFDENIAIVRLELPIYRIKKMQVSLIDENDFKDITRFVKTEAEYKLLDVEPQQAGDEAQNNSIIYKQGAKEIGNWGQNVKQGLLLFDQTVWSEMFTIVYGTKPAGDDAFLKNYKFIVEYDTLMIDNRFFVKSLSFSQDNKKGSIVINTADRINEFSKIVSLARNKLSRLGAKVINKVVQHRKLDDVYELGCLDTDSNLKIAASEVFYSQGQAKTTYLLTEDLNILSEEVGVNSVARETDTLIGSGRLRAEVYEDYILFGDVDDFNTENDSSLTSDGLDIYTKLFTTDVVSSQYSHFLINGTTEDSSKIPSSIIPADVSAANRLIKWRIPFLSETFIDNEIVTGESNRLQEKGVRYTDASGKLETLNIKYGFAINQSTNATEIRQLPNSQDFILDFQDQGTYLTGTEVYDKFGSGLPNASFPIEPERYENFGLEVRTIGTYTDSVSGLSMTTTISNEFVLWDVGLNNWIPQGTKYQASGTLIEIGTFSTTETDSDQTLEGNSVSDSINTTTGRKTVTLEKTYVFAQTVFKQIEFDWFCNAPDEEIEAKVTIDIKNTAGVFEENIFSLTYIGALVGTGAFDRNIVEFGLGSDTVIADLKSIQGSELRITVDFLIGVNLFFDVNYEISFDNLTLTTTDIEINSQNDGLLIKLNPYEILYFDYINHLHILNDAYILGDALTLKNSFINSDFTGFTDLEVWTYNGKYSKYNTNVIKGTNRTDLTVSVNVFTTTVTIEDRTTQSEVGLTETFAIVGVKNSERFLLIVRNSTGASISKFKYLDYHFHPLEVYDY